MSIAVFYFGGYLASQPDIDAWLRSARAQKPSIAFTGFAWPRGATSDAPSAVRGFKQRGRFEAVINDIQGNDADTIYIVGHSSGCAIANAIDAGLEYTNDIVLVALDGFTPGNDQLDRTSTQVWGAMCDGVRSRNFPGDARGRRRIFNATGCKTEWALHFSVVNTAARDGIVTNVSLGYAGCQANLAFLT